MDGTSEDGSGSPTTYYGRTQDVKVANDFLNTRESPYFIGKVIEFIETRAIHHRKEIK
jgi:hypothetical protein